MVYYLCDLRKHKGYKMKIYLDNCCFNRPYDNQDQVLISLETQAKLYIQQMIKNGEIQLVTSFILWYELSQNPYSMRKKGITDFIKENTSEFVNVDEDRHIKMKAEKIMATGVQMKDAYHLACAIDAGCDYLVTTDKRMLKYTTQEIMIINPINFVQEKGGGIS